MKSILPPILILAALLAASLWSGGAVSRAIDGCIQPVEEAYELAAGEDWPAAIDALSRSYGYWQRCRNWLAAAEPHSGLTEAEGMFRRAFASAAAEERSDFLADTARLASRLRLPARAEDMLPENIL